jgi:hypothetical protein
VVVGRGLVITSLLRRRGGVGVVGRVGSVLLATVGRVTALLLTPILGSRLALAVAVGVVLGRLLAVATASALLALVVVILRGHVVLMSHFSRIMFRYDTVNKKRFEIFWGN